MSGYQETEDEYMERIRSLKYAYNRFVDEKISYYDYMNILDDNYDILNSSQMEQVKNWKAELAKRAEEDKIEKQKADFKKALKGKENEQAFFHFLLIGVAVLGIIIFIWSKTQK